MARTAQLFTHTALENAIKQGNATLIDREAERKAHNIDMKALFLEGKDAEADKLQQAYDNRMANAVEVFGASHVKVLNRVIRAFQVSMSNAEKLRVVTNFTKANGGESRVATLVNASEAERKRQAEARKALKR